MVVGGLYVLWGLVWGGRVCPFYGYIQFGWFNGVCGVVCRYVNVVDVLGGLLEAWGESVIGGWGVLVVFAYDCS